MPTILRQIVLLCGGSIALVSIGACNGPETVVVTDDSQQTAMPETEPIEDEAPNNAIVTVQGVRLEIPSRWEPAPTGSTFTAVQYSVPAPDGDPAKVATLTISNPIGGGLMYNTLRWSRQFRGENAETESWLTINGDLQVMRFFGRGPFDTGLPGSTGVQDDTVVLGAVPIVNGPERVEAGEPDENGRYAFTIDPEAKGERMSNIFIKLTGPAETVLAAREEWEAMINSIRVRDVSSWATP
ncbi:MAG: hypothetical protein ACIAQF_04970 [Phycisphaerales bacterium JB065]